MIITHDRFGWYGHPDHIKCHQATLRAYELLYGLKLHQPMPRNGPAHPGKRLIPRLYLSSFPKRLVKLAAGILPLIGQDPHRFGQNRDIDLVQIASWRVPVTAKINVGPYLGIREQAVACHASQRPLTQSSNLLFRLLWQRAQESETFCRLYPAFAPGEPVETDLFGWSTSRPLGPQVPPIWARMGLVAGFLSRKLNAQQGMLACEPLNSDYS